MRGGPGGGTQGEDRRASGEDMGGCGGGGRSFTGVSLGQCWGERRGGAPPFDKNSVWRLHVRTLISGRRPRNTPPCPAFFKRTLGMKDRPQLVVHQPQFWIGWTHLAPRHSPHFNQTIGDLPCICWTPLASRPLGPFPRLPPGERLVSTIELGVKGGCTANEGLLLPVWAPPLVQLCAGDHGESSELTDPSDRLDGITQSYIQPQRQTTLPCPNKTCAFPEASLQQCTYLGLALKKTHVPPDCLGGMHSKFLSLGAPWLQDAGIQEGVDQAPRESCVIAVRRHASTAHKTIHMLASAH